ncbi:MAG: TldD/PmbA family protein [Rhodospirillaceae bacterium]|jgi:PmbA protein|nr:TldD/PmbA family protein [Rhodospirillaceae bacterium]MBT5459415.1 TldD/PmbA family protein [Rhodospirillaceae bacterium]
MASGKKPLDILDGLLDRVKKAGGDGADALVFDSASLEISQRLGKPEKLERSESADVGLRVFVGKRQAIVSSTDQSDDALDEMVERAIAMAKAAPDDPYCGIAEPGQIATKIPKLDIYDPSEPETQALIDIAIDAEDAARAVPGVTNSEGADVGWSHASIALAATNGFAQTYAVSSNSFSASVIAGEGTDMERDYDYASAVYMEDLPSPAEIGKSAGERAVKRLGARKMKTTQVPVVYDPRVSGGLVRHLTGAINGASIARGTSFLKDSMGEAVFSPGINIVDDPLRPRGLRSKPFDGEGFLTSKKTLIEDGKLTTWILDLASARQLGLASTGNASRGTGGPPSPGATNIYLEAGEPTPEELMADIEEGFYVTELIGMGINGLTGDYSRGASGFWIEKGQIAFPVSEMTIAGNLNDMFKALRPANDLVFKFGTDAPTLRIDGMTVAGV